MHKLHKLTGKQKNVGQFIAKNLETIVEIESLNDFSDIIGVSNTTISIVLTKLNLGSFSTFKNDLLKMI